MAKLVTSLITGSNGQFLKVTKIRDLGMELRFFVVRFGICLRGVALEMRVGCKGFSKMGPL